MEDINWNIMGPHEIRRRFFIPVGGVSRKEAEKQIRELMKLYNFEFRNEKRKNWIQKIFGK